MQGLGDRIRARARQLGMSDADVAKRLDVSSSRYSKYVLDQREPDYRTLISICEILACSPTDLLTESKVDLTPGDIRLARCASALASLDDGTAEVVVGMLEAASAAALKART